MITESPGRVRTMAAADLRAARQPDVPRAEVPPPRRPDETAIDMVERAAQGLIDRHGHDAIANVDVLITHTQMPDMPFYGGGGGMAHRLGMKPKWVLDLHNGGCAAFVLGAEAGPPTARVRARDAPR